jgi:hypothetical protein
VVVLGVSHGIEEFQWGSLTAQELVANRLACIATACLPVECMLLLLSYARSPFVPGRPGGCQRRFSSVLSGRDHDAGGQLCTVLGGSTIRSILITMGDMDKKLGIRGSKVQTAERGHGMVGSAFSCTPG